MKHCTYPRCACKATGVFCDNKPKKKAPKGIKKVSEKQKIKLVDKKDLLQNDAAFYFSIWQERKHVCWCCITPIKQSYGDVFRYVFHHILPKRSDGGYPQYRHSKWNIMLLCYTCHNSWETDPDSRPKITAEFQRLLKLHEDGKLKP